MPCKPRISTPLSHIDWWTVLITAHLPHLSLLPLPKQKLRTLLYSGTSLAASPRFHRSSACFFAPHLSEVCPCQPFKCSTARSAWTCASNRHAHVVFPAWALALHERNVWCMSFLLAVTSPCSEICWPNGVLTTEECADALNVILEDLLVKNISQLQPSLKLPSPSCLALLAAMAFARTLAHSQGWLACSCDPQKGKPFLHICTAFLCGIATLHLPPMCWMSIVSPERYRKGEHRAVRLPFTLKHIQSRTTRQCHPKKLPKPGRRKRSRSRRSRTS